MGTTSQEFCLRWNNHQSTVMSVMSSLFERESLVDVTLAAEGKFLRVHRLVLCACSSYFEELLSQQTEKQAIIFLKDVKFEELRALIDYMYRGEVSVAQDRLTPFLRTAESLSIKGLADKDDRSRKFWEGSAQGVDEIMAPLVDMEPLSSRLPSETPAKRYENKKGSQKKKRRTRSPPTPEETTSGHNEGLSVSAETEMDSDNFIPVHEDPETKTEIDYNTDKMASSRMAALVTQNEWKPSEGFAPMQPVIAESFSMDNSYDDPSHIEDTGETPLSDIPATAGGRLPKCHRCGGVFKSIDSLQRHERSDCRVQQRFTCLICPYSSNRRFNVKMHLAKKHKLPPELVAKY